MNQYLIEFKTETLQNTLVCPEFRKKENISHRFLMNILSLSRINLKDINL